MGIAIPQVITSDRASGAQIIDGSLNFDGGYLERDPGSAGNRKIFTWSGWVKLNDLSSFYLLNVPDGVGHASFMFDSGQLRWNTYNTSTNGLFTSNAYFRDTGWYHVVFAFDATESTTTDRIKVYVNGERLTSSSYTAPDGSDTPVNNTVEHNLGANQGAVSGDVNITNNYFIDGQALGPEYFGYTDGLTNTWKPKKYEGTFGTNGYYLPMDGNSPIGKDQSGQGNDWTPVDFGGSVSLDNPQVSGARPILNTMPGGTLAGVGVFGSKENVGYAVTVYNDGYGNKYYIDGVKQATLTGLIRGATYTFDTSDSTVASHPFVFGSTAEGNNFARGATYGTISAGSAGAATTITIPYDAPETLYYHCSSHSGMGSSIVGIHTDETKADQYASNCVLALPFNGSKNDVSASIACTSSTRAVSLTGNTAASDDKSNFYKSSFEFDGTGDYLDVTESDNCFDFGTGDFTIELWAYLDNNCDLIGTGSNYVFLGSNKGGWVIRRFDEGIKFSYQYNSSWVYENTFGTEESRDKWNHIAITRSGSTVRCFSNGVQQGSDDSSSADIISTEGYCRVGGGYGENSNLLADGYVQDVRIYKGVAKYTSDFVVPSPFPDIVPDTPSGVSGGSKLIKIANGNGGVGFGTNGYMTTTSSDYNPGTGDFAIEGYFKFPTNSGTRRAFINEVTTFGNNALVIRQYNTGFNFYCGGQNLDDSGSGINMTQWNHAMITRSGSTIRYFVNGELRGTDTSSESISCNPTNQMTIGGYYDTGSKSEFMQGHVSNLRFTVGSIPTEYQTSLTDVGKKVFTPSSEPLTSTSQGATSSDVKLLCCQSPTSATAATVASGSLSTNSNVEAITFSPFNTDIRAVRGQETEYPTMTPLAKNSSITLEDGNLRITQTDSHGQKKIVYSNAHIPNGGKWYVEWIMGGAGACTLGIGINGKVEFRGSDTQIGASGNNNSWGYEPQGNLFHNGKTDGGYGSCAAGDVIGMTIDTSGATLTIQWHKNGRLIERGDGTTCQFTGISLDEDYIVMMSHHTPQYDTIVNFGQKPFKFPPPDGFQPLSAANTRPETIIANPSKFVGVATYYGSGSTLQELDLGFKPDLVWAKSTTNAENHAWFDSVRGSTKFLRSDSSDNEYTISDVNFTLNGFSYANSSGEINESGQTYASFAWRAGGNKSTFNVDDVGYTSAAAAGLDGGTLTPTGASVGTKQGFSIIGFTGPGSTGTYSHGLSQKPKFMIFKNRDDDSSSWLIYHSAFGATKYISFTTAVPQTSNNPFNDTEPTSSVFTAGNWLDNSDTKYIGYIWCDVPGMQRFGQFNGNGNADGVFVELGFKPAMLLIKNDNNTGDWIIWDNERNKFNPVNRQIWPYTTSGTYGDYDQVGSNYPIDFLSNGFKMRTTDADMNDGSRTYLYAAWAEAPSVNLFGGGANAR